MSSDRRRPSPPAGRSSVAVPSDWQRINLLDRLEVAYWCRALGCSQADLQEAVRSVGVLVTHVRTWLAQKR